MTKDKTLDKIIELCKKMKWSYWFTNEGKFVIDVDGSLEICD